MIVALVVYLVCGFRRKIGIEYVHSVSVAAMLAKRPLIPCPRNRLQYRQVRGGADVNWTASLSAHSSRIVTRSVSEGESRQVHLADNPADVSSQPACDRDDSLQHSGYNTRPVAEGKVQWCNDTSGHLDPDARVSISAIGHLLANEGKLYLAGCNAVLPAIYDQRDGRCLNDRAPLAKCESTSPRGWELFLVGDRVIACGKPYYSRPELEVFDRAEASRDQDSQSSTTKPGTRSKSLLFLLRSLPLLARTTLAIFRSIVPTCVFISRNR